MDTAIEARGLASFVQTMREEAADEKLYRFWLHKVMDGSSFKEWRRKALYSAKNANMTAREQQDIVSQTRDILRGFDPEGVSG